MHTIYKGHIAHAPHFGALKIIENGFLVTDNGRIEGVYDTLPAQFAGHKVEDLGDRLLIPSFSDLHLHAPQYAMLGMGMDLQLLDWLNNYTFPTEARFSDPAYARVQYAHLAHELISLGTTRVSIYSSVHRQSTHVLAQELERAGVGGYVGKVNMDRNGPDNLVETTGESIAQTRLWIDECRKRYSGIAPILTPRFTPSCTDELMAALGELAKNEGLRVQSHLSENIDEQDWVRALCPDVKAYYESYLRHGLFQRNTLMAHCVYSDARERAAMRENGVWMVHCPDSNTNIASGIAPVRLMLDEGVSVALGSDIAGGAVLSMMDVTTHAIRQSKMRWLNSGKCEAFLTFREGFYLATSAGAEYFGAGPGFKSGDMLHAIVLDDSMLPPLKGLSIEHRLERIFYLSRGRCVAACIANGRKVFSR